ncbi:MAG: hypothetical protein PV344_08350, partial [Anaplasma sp.]|nr:hypothetical protein [Anaplasma sp.]
SSCRRKAGVGGVTRKSGLVERVMTSQPHDLAREFQTTHNACVKRDVTREIKVIKRWHVMRIKGRHMSQIISLYKVIHLPWRRI